MFNFVRFIKNIEGYVLSKQVLFLLSETIKYEIRAGIYR